MSVPKTLQEGNLSAGEEDCCQRALLDGEGQKWHVTYQTQTPKRQYRSQYPPQIQGHLVVQTRSSPRASWQIVYAAGLGYLMLARLMAGLESISAYQVDTFPSSILSVLFVSLFESNQMYGRLTLSFGSQYGAMDSLSVAIVLGNRGSWTGLHLSSFWYDLFTG